MKTQISLIALSVSFVSVVTFAQSPGVPASTEVPAQNSVGSQKIKADKETLKTDKQVRNKDQDQVKVLREKMLSDKKAGASKDVLQADRKALQQARLARNKDQMKVNEDRKELRQEKKTEKKSEPAAESVRK